MFIFEKNPKNFQKPVEYTLPDGTKCHDTFKTLKMCKKNFSPLKKVVEIKNVSDIRGFTGRYRNSSTFFSKRDIFVTFIFVDINFTLIRYLPIDFDNINKITTVTSSTSWSDLDLLKLKT